MFAEQYWQIRGISVNLTTFIRDMYPYYGIKYR